MEIDYFEKNYEKFVIDNINNEYENVVINTGSNNDIEWNNCISVINDKIIKNSNSFLWEFLYYSDNMRNFQNNSYKIYNNLYNNYNSIINTQNKNIIKYEESMYFYMINAFVYKNVGHDLSCLLEHIHFLLNTNIKNVIIMKGYKETNNFKICKFLFSDDINFIEIDYNNFYFFKNITIIKDTVCNLLKYEYLIEKIINNIINEKKTQYENTTKYNVILMKTNRNKNLFLSHSQHKCEKFLQELEQNNFINIIPENMDIFELSCILLNANIIITSEGCISYYNRIFFNKNAKLIFIGTSIWYFNMLNTNNDNFLHINTHLTDETNSYEDIQSQIYNMIK